MYSQRQRLNRLSSLRRYSADADAKSIHHLDDLDHEYKEGLINYYQQYFVPSQFEKQLEQLAKEAQKVEGMVQSDEAMYMATLYIDTFRNTHKKLLKDIEKSVRSTIGKHIGQLLEHTNPKMVTDYLKKNK